MCVRLYFGSSLSADFSKCAQAKCLSVVRTLPVGMSLGGGGAAFGPSSLEVLAQQCLDRQLLPCHVSCSSRGSLDPLVLLVAGELGNAVERQVPPLPSTLCWWTLHVVRTFHDAHLLCPVLLFLPSEPRFCSSFWEHPLFHYIH